MRRGEKKQSLRDFTRGQPSKEDDEYFAKAMNEPSDLACAILQAISIERELEGGILARLYRSDQSVVDLLSKDNGALGTFFAKIGLGYAMGVYDADIMEQLNVVRRIRNAFAHSRRRISFGSPVIRAELHAVKVHKGASEGVKKYFDGIKALTAPEMQDAKIGTGDMGSTLSLSGRSAYVILSLTLNIYLVRAQTAVYKARALHLTKE